MFTQLATSLLSNFAVVNCKQTFFFLIPWDQYLSVTVNSVTQHCEVNSFHTLDTNSSFLLIALAVLDDLLRVAALVAVAYVIFGGFKYITSQGSPDGTKNAQSTIINAMVGLVIAIIAASVVAFLGNSLGGAGG